jgi:GT2 family glycosyltransferase
VSELALSIVVPVHDNAGTLDQQLQALVSSTDGRSEIVVVDNLSTDGSRAIADGWAARCSRVSVVSATDLATEAHARNVGVRASRCDAIAFCDGDDVVSDTWAGAMADALGQHRYVTGPVDVDTLNPPWLAGVRGRALFDAMPRTFGVPFAHGCNLGVRREAVEAVGWFDEQVRIGTDIDFAIRAWRAGVELAWAPAAVVSYRHRPSARARWRQGVAYGRAQHHIVALLGDRVPAEVLRKQRMRRAGWLVRHALLLARREGRARWLWTASLLAGDVLGPPRG